MDSHAATVSRVEDRDHLLRLARAFLSWEQELGGFAIPTVATPLASTGHDVQNPQGGTKESLLTVVQDQVRNCERCRLAAGRTNTAFARGHCNARIVFVGEGPGEQEDRTGVPFVGPAGQLLDKMIAAMGLGQDDYYICNVVKCRPPGNRAPEPDEASQCLGFLNEQLRVVSPQVIVALGRTAAVALGQCEPGERGWRGRWGSYLTFPVISTFHPSYLLREPAGKRAAWTDLQSVMARVSH